MFGELLFSFDSLKLGISYKVKLGISYKAKKPGSFRASHGQGALPLWNAAP